jgi:CHAT domain-containing protein
VELYRALARENPGAYRGGLAMALNNLGIALGDLGRYEEALEAHREAVELFRALARENPGAYRGGLARALNGLGVALRNLGRYEEALGAFQEAVGHYRALARENPGAYRGGLAMALGNLGHLLLLRESWEEAVRVLWEGMEAVEGLRAEALSLWRRESILREHLQIYENLLLVLMRLGRYGEALEVAERGKSRALLDLLTSRELAPRDVPEELARAYRELVARARRLAADLESGERGEWLDPGPGGERGSGGAGEARQRALRELGEVHRQLKETLDAIRKHDPDFLPAALPLGEGEVRKLARGMGAVLVLLRVMGAGSFAFLVFPDGELEVVRVEEFTSKTLLEVLLGPGGEEAPGGWLGAYLAYRQETKDKEAARRAWWQALEATLDRLYRDLLQGVHAHLREWRAAHPSPDPLPLVLVPNKGLALLPLHAASWKGGGRRRYLLEEYPVRYAPSLTLLRRLWERERQERPRQRLLVLANPEGNLPWSEWEGRALSHLLAGGAAQVYTREEATQARLLRKAGESHYLHLACHGSYRLDRPLASALRLADGEVSLGEMLEKLHLPQSQLVVLSACETSQVNALDPADEHYGLHLAFLHAGAPGVYGSLWAVNDLATALLMVRVYQGLREGLDKAQALREAQLWLRDLPGREAGEVLRAMGAERGWAEGELGEVLRYLEKEERPFSHPHYWAAFQYVGA